MKFYLILRKLLFLFSPEFIHNVVICKLSILQYAKPLLWITKRVFDSNSSDTKVNLLGIDFPNPVGLAAGLDKNADAVKALSALGFGFIEIGTVTPKPQPGNEKPRAFRLIEDSALINRMGFNNNGLEHIVSKLKNRNDNIIVAGNIGKNKITSNENAIEDYVSCINTLYKYVNFFVVNISSPNTPNLRELQDKEPLEFLLSTLIKERNTKPIYKPILLKIAPDLSFNQIDDVLDVLEKVKIDGIVATNTTISRSNLKTEASKIADIGYGGLSGKPLFKKSTEIVQYIHDRTSGKFPIIAVGGIMSAEDAIEKFKAGASLIQLYTGFIYQGPALIKEINRAYVKYKSSVMN